MKISKIIMLPVFVICTLMISLESQGWSDSSSGFEGEPCDSSSDCSFGRTCVSRKCIEPPAATTTTPNNSTSSAGSDAAFPAAAGGTGGNAFPTISGPTFQYGSSNTATPAITTTGTTNPATPPAATAATTPTKTPTTKSETGKACKTTCNKNQECKDEKCVAKKDTKTDECSASNIFSEEQRVRCAATKGLIKGSEATSKVLSTMGQTTATMYGQIAQTKASTTGTQSAALDGAGDAMIATGGTQVTTGGINTVLGIAVIAQGARHTTANVPEFKKKVGTLKGGMDEKQKKLTTCQNDPACAKSPVLALRLQELNTAKTEYNKYNGALAKATAEQKDMTGKATAVGAMSMIQGAAQISQGGMNIWAGQEMKKEADKLAAAEALQGQALPGLAPDLAGDISAPVQSAAITGDGAIEAAAEGDAQATADQVPELGPGFDPMGNQGGPGAGPAAGAFKAGGGEGGGGAGSSAGLGGGGTAAAATAGDDQPAAKLADNAKNPAGYGAGGGGYMGGGSGGGASGSGPDLSSLLASLLPTKEEEEAKNQAMLDYAGRDPAGGEPVSLLDSKTDIFKRIHTTYQDKHKKGAIGL